MDVELVPVSTLRLPADWQTTALASISQGKGVRFIVAHLGVTVLEWAEILDSHPAFAARFHRARKLALEVRSDDLLTVPNDIVDETTAKSAGLYSKNVQWLLERRIPDMYGRRDQMDINVQVDIRSALEEGRKRLDPSGLARWLVGED